MKRILISLILVVAILISGCGGPKITTWTDINFCMHALGATKDGTLATNTIEAFRYNYKEQGQRLFEVDIQITSDGVAVLRHDWASDLGQGEAFGWTEENKFPVTAEEFLNAPIYGQYEPATLLDLYKELSKKKDAYLIIDPKYTKDVKSQFEVIVNTAIDNGLEDVLKRVVVQIYYEDMLKLVKEVYPFENYLYTLYYLSNYEFSEVADFCLENNIPVVTMSKDVYQYNGIDELTDKGIMVYIHTVNDTYEALMAFQGGVHGIYSDTVTSKVFFEG